MVNQILEKLALASVDIIKWGITTVVGILGIIIGRYWVKLDKRNLTDLETLRVLEGYLPYDKMQHIETYDFGDAFDFDRHLFLHNFYNERTNPRFIFINKNLENNKISLFDSVNNFLQFIGLNTQPSDNPTTIILKVPYETPDRNEVVNHLNDLATDVFTKYTDLFNIAKSKLL